jgi:hypothetical protein
MEIQLRILVSREGFEAGELGIDDRLEGSEVLDRRNELGARWETLSRNELEDAIEAVRARGGSLETLDLSRCALS